MFLESREQAILKANNLIAICEPIVKTKRDPQQLTTL
jgi:hypothetical protein